MGCLDVLDAGTLPCVGLEFKLDHFPGRRAWLRVTLRQGSPRPPPHRCVRVFSVFPVSSFCIVTACMHATVHVGRDCTHSSHDWQDGAAKAQKGKLTTIMTSVEFASGGRKLREVQLALVICLFVCLMWPHDDFPPLCSPPPLLTIPSSGRSSTLLKPAQWTASLSKSVPSTRPTPWQNTIC